MYVITYIYDILILPQIFSDMVILAEIFGGAPPGDGDTVILDFFRGDMVIFAEKFR